MGGTVGQLEPWELDREDKHTCQRYAAVLMNDGRLAAMAAVLDTGGDGQSEHVFVVFIPRLRSGLWAVYNYSGPGDHVLIACPMEGNSRHSGSSSGARPPYLRVERPPGANSRNNWEIAEARKTATFVFRIRDPGFGVPRTSVMLGVCVWPP